MYGGYSRSILLTLLTQSQGEGCSWERAAYLYVNLALAVYTLVNTAQMLYVIHISVKLIYAVLCNV